MHRGGVFLPPARVTVRINEKEKEKKRKEKKPRARPELQPESLSSFIHFFPRNQRVP
jgi:hypothetical protein